MRSILVIFIALFIQAQAGESIAGKDLGYRETCQKAAADDHTFKNFRSMHEYQRIVEFKKGSRKFAAYVANSSKEVIDKLELFRKLDTIGNPSTKDYPKVGVFSPTTLRYIAFAHQIKKIFKLPKDPKIGEIGAGFGGQCYIFSHLHPFSKYYIYDLPEVNPLIEKTMSTLEVKNVRCMPADAQLPEEKIDLLISNYAFSECDRKTQLDYFERVIKKADRGYVVYNQFGNRLCNMDSLSPGEFVALLEKNKMHPRIEKELIPTAPDNVLILWDKTLF